MRIAPSSMTVVSQWGSDEPKVRRRHQNSTANLSMKRKGMLLSKKSQRNITKCIDWMGAQAKRKWAFSEKHGKRYSWRVNFITLTMPSECSEVCEKDFQKYLFQPFLQTLRKYWQLRNYIWKLEVTEAGVLHMHLATDTFISKSGLRKAWNKRLKESGLLEGFYLKYGHYDPPTTRVEIPRNIRNVGGYLASELAKNVNDRQSQGGRLWGCNYELSRAKELEVHLAPAEASEYLSPAMRGAMPHKYIESEPDANGRRHTWAVLLMPRPRDWIANWLGPIKQAFVDTLFYLRTGYEAPPLFAYETGI